MILKARRLKFCVSRPIKNGVGAPAEHDDPEWPRYVRITDIQDARTLRNDTFRSLPPEIAVEASFDVGDILAAAVGATFGKTYLHTISTGPVAFAGYLVRISPSKEFDARYVAYWTESHHYWGQVNSNVIQATIQNFSAAKFAELEIPVPTRDTQILIANYLDRETARIDGLIAEKERMLALLEEKRAALISRVVTRGLDPNAPLKPSGLEWLGEIPEHWDVLPLRWFIRIGSGEFLSNELISSEKTEEMPTPVVGGNGILGYAREANTEDALVIGRVGALCGNVHFFNGPLWVTDNALLVQITSRFDPRYLREVLHLMKLNTLANQSAQPLITGEMVKSQKVPVPPIQEQENILRELNIRSEVYNCLFEELSNSTRLLKERRAALITAAVTGQIPLEEMIE